MAVRLKPLSEQTIVITGAASGIGLTTARMAAEAGARVVAVARDEAALARLVGEITAAGGRAVHVVADVSDVAAIDRAADVAVATFGRIDTWVNNAAVGVFGRVTEIALDDARRIMDINFFGQVHGSLAAVRHLQQRRAAADGSGRDAYGMALVNVGSTESDQPLPLHSYYAASKHALKGFTTALRMELEEAGLPISVTLVKPGSIDTPFLQHARNYMAKEGNYPPPVYAPEVVARAILYAATHPSRDLFAGGGGWMLSAAGRFAPRLTDRVMERTMFRKQQQDVPPDGRDALRSPGAYGGQARGTYPGTVRGTSLYTAAELHPVATKLALVAVAAAGAGAAVLALGAGSGRARKTPATLKQAAPRATTAVARRLAKARQIAR
ncbi:MAG: yxnA [Phycisphaerales bacterium]|nr:yxnA [Phycisphaerales bacterium]